MTAHRPRANYPPFWGCKHDSSIRNSDGLGEAGLGLLKVDDVPDRRKILQTNELLDLALGGRA